MDSPFRNGHSKTLQELYEEELALDAEAEAQKARNWGDENCCTYDKGYYRQPIYSCLDCAEKSGHQVGVCYGCYLKCHLHHRTEEVFFKRHFRCDCGNASSGNQCELSTSKKDTENAENKYSKNFKGLYCWCDDSYDPKYQFMFGCVVCENWFHKECIEQKEGPDGSIAFVLDPVAKSVPADFVCEECFTKNPFLQFYSHLRVTVSSLESYKQELQQEKSKQQAEISDNNNHTETTKENETNTNNNPTETSTENVASTSSSTVCKLKEQAPSKDPNVHNTFWKNGWKHHLCECQDCLAMYKQLGVSFLLDEKDLLDEIDEEVEDEEELSEENEDTQHPPKRKADEISLNGKSTYEILEEQFLQSDKLSLENKNNAISGLKQFTRLLEEFLKPILQSESREVTAQDIAAFTEHLGLKKQKLT